MEVLKDAIYNGKKDDGTDIIPLPYAVIATRVKRLDRIYEKLLEVLYDIRDTDNTLAKFRDVRGARVVLADEEKCFNLLKALRNDTKNFIIEDGDVDDWIHEPKHRENGSEYKSIHVHPTYANVVYSVHIRTHSMDRAALTDPQLLHDAKYLVEKRQMIIRDVPYQIRRLVAAVMGVTESPLLIKN